MHFWHTAFRFSLLASAILSSAAETTWGYTDATVSVQTKGSGVGAGVKEQYVQYKIPEFTLTSPVIARIPDNKRLSKPISLGDADNLKLTLTTQEGRTAKRAHQTFLLLTDSDTGLNIAYPFNVKDNGKSRLDLVTRSVCLSTSSWS